MSDEIISRERIRAKARAAHAAGQGRDSHNMNWGATARTTWLIEYDHLTTVSLAETRAFLAAADTAFDARRAA